MWQIAGVNKLKSPINENVYNEKTKQPEAVIYSAPGRYFWRRSSVKETAWRWWRPRGTPHLWESLKTSESCLIVVFVYYFIYYFPSKSWIIAAGVSILPVSMWKNTKCSFCAVLRNNNNECKTCCAKNQRGQVLCCTLQGCRSSQRLGIHGGEDAVEARQRPGLHTLHPKGQKGTFLLMKTKHMWRSPPQPSQ